MYLKKRLGVNWRSSAYFLLIGMVGGDMLRGQVLVDPARQFLEQERQKQQQQERERPVTPLLPERESPLLPAEEAEEDPEAAGFMVQRIVLKGLTVLSGQKVQAVIRRYEQQKLTLTKINSLIGELTNLLIEAGYITTRVYIPEQNIASGTLELLVVEGKIASITHRNDSYRDHWLTWMAFPIGPGRVLRLPELEQGMDQINRVPSAKAKLTLLPGEEPGETRIVIENKPVNPFRASLGYDNFGEAASGQDRVRLGYEVDNFLSLNETTSTTFLTSRGTNALAFSQSVPLGWWTAYHSFSYSEYLVPLTTAAELFGDYIGYTTGLNCMVWRNAQHKTSVDASFTLKRSERFVNSVALEPANLSVVRTGVSHVYRPGDAAWQFDAGFSFGLPVFFAQEDAATLPSANPHHEFHKLDFAVSMYRSIWEWLDYRGTAQAQYAVQGLFSTEQFILGDVTTVRGYRGSSVTGEDGVLWRNEFLFRYPSSTGSRAGDWWVEKVQPYLFLDTGYTELKSATQGGTLAGGGVGLRWQWERFNFDATLARPLYEDGPLAVERRDYEFYLTATLRVY
jgi:hemolysin activation/secretion protein